MGEVVETLPKHRSSFAAPIVFVIVFAFQFFSRWLEQLKKGGGKSATATRLRGEIKDLKSAPCRSHRHLRKLRNFGGLQLLRRKNLQIVLTYIVLVCWFWRVPVASISQQLVQPFGKIISWRAGGVVNENVMVGIIPWLILSTRVRSSRG